MTALLLTCFERSGVPARAAETVPAPKITVTVAEDLSSAQIKIGKTKDAAGYRIYISEPEDQPFKKIASVKKNGTKVRTYTCREDRHGTYKIKVKAYRTVNGKKVTSKYSNVVTFELAADHLADIPKGIRFVGNPKTDFLYNGKGEGESEDNPYTFEYEVDEEYADAYVIPKLVNDSGSECFDSCFSVTDDGGIYVNRRGEVYLIFIAFEKPEDAWDMKRAVAVSEKLKLRGVNEEGKTGFEPIKYADITFKNGYAYFGLAPTELVKDTKLASKIIEAGKTQKFGIKYEDEQYEHDYVQNKGPFKFVPIEWRVLEKTDKYALLMSNSIIDGGGYDGWREAKTTTWKTSCMYYMLNNSHEYTKEEKSYSPKASFNERVLMEMNVGGVKCKRAIPTIEVLTNKKYGFSTSREADKNRIVKPSEYYDICTNHNATRGSLKLYGLYWVVNEKAGKTVFVDTTGKINEGKIDCNVYEVGSVYMIKVDLTLCNVFEE